MPRLIGLVLMGLFIFVACTGMIVGSAHAQEAQVRVGCIVFEDDSFMCGTLDPEGWLDRRHPYVVGCIPRDVSDPAPVTCDID